ncbi:hypothetical protein BJ742DRAFT_351667 [Cladochytrium replicatum]|nr:hypothetical protein BJ742DRAFT_351667 [Cladochytrium replicatum]
MNINAVGRTQEYTELEQEPPAIISEARQPSNWPNQGRIVVENLFVKYAKDAPLEVRESGDSVYHDAAFETKCGRRETQLSREMSPSKLIRSKKLVLLVRHQIADPCMYSCFEGERGQGKLHFRSPCCGLFKS